MAGAFFKKVNAPRFVGELFPPYKLFGFCFFITFPSPDYSIFIGWIHRLE